MASNYDEIRADNERRYGTDIGRIGPMLLANRYDDRTHFIFELLQNAEDALARRHGWEGSRAVNFALSQSALRVSHFGKPFDDLDVRGICGIAESTKDLTAIGRFGIGFKSVYAFTDRPEVHSGAEDFAIESFVWPTAAPHLDRGDDETVIILPLETQDDKAREEITRGLQRLGPRMLLFLSQMEEIAWNVEKGPSGLYLQSKPEAMGDDVRQITVIGQEEGEPDIEETWLLFSREAKTDEGVVAGYVEIAFSIGQEDETGQCSIQRISDSPLVVFFPTVLQTHLGFLVQGPYRTTPSRDNVPRSDPWNQHLVGETATLLVESLRWLRDHEMLDTATLQALPLDQDKFGENNMLAPMFGATRDALSSEPLLPCFGGGYVSASTARLARTQELRELFDTNQLAALFDHDGELAWLSGDITQDRMPELRQYLMRELEIAEVTPETILPLLDERFLKAQPDDWIAKLYEFLNGQAALRKRLGDLPLIRLEDGTHVAAHSNDQPQAFLPGAIETDFPTVRRAVCTTDEAREFLQSLGLTEPDTVDDVVRNVLPKYWGEEVDVGANEYEADIRRILGAFGTDSKSQREKLLAALRESVFVMAVDAGNGSKCVSKPDEVYIATERLKELFRGVADILLVDDSYGCLRGEDVRELLEACGATRYLQPVPVDPEFTWEQRQEMRIFAGCEDCTSEEPITDHTLRGLDQLLDEMPQLDAQTQAKKAALLWEALGDVQDRRGTGIFAGTYHWLYVYRRSTTFDPTFVRQLNEKAWVPGANGSLSEPEFIVFDSLGWESHPFLLSKIRFKPPVIETLAKEAGIEPGVLELLKKEGVTSVAELIARLRVDDQSESPDAPGPGVVDKAVANLLGKVPGPTPPATDPTGPEPPGAGGRSRRGRRGGGKRAPGGTGGRPFISYVGAHPEEGEPDPDGLDQQARMALEENAIEFILGGEPYLKRTPTHNPGFDLFEESEDGQPARWVEVKAMTGTLNDRPVGLSRTQFECAREHGDAYWLYVVEQAGDDSARVVRIQDPAGKSRTFTFDHGWLSIADVGPKQENRED